MQKLLEAAEAVARQGIVGIMTKPEKVMRLRIELRRFRCTCGSVPTEGSAHGYWCVRCCNHEWDSWEDFLEWREERDAKETAP
jgi:hypothetical protein